MINIILICLLMMPWIILPLNFIQDQMRLPQAMFMDLMFMLIIVSGIISGNKFIYRNKWLGYFIGYVFLNLFIGFIIPFFLEIKGVGRSLKIYTIEPFLHLMLGLFATMTVLSNLTREDFVRIAKALCLSSVLVSAVAILQFFRIDIFGGIAVYLCDNRVAACLDNPNLVANYLVLCSPLFLMFKDLRFKLGFLLTMLGLAATRSHLGCLLFVLGCLLWLCLNYKRWWYITGGILLCLSTFIVLNLTKFFIFFRDISDGRWACWQIAFTKLKVNPIFGQGLGIWKNWMVYIKTTYWMNVHNDWLELAVCIGLAGVLLLALVVINSLRNFSYKETENKSFACMFVIFLVMMFFSFPLETATIATLGLVSFWACEKL